MTVYWESGIFTGTSSFFDVHANYGTVLSGSVQREICYDQLIEDPDPRLVGPTQTGD